PHLRGHAGRRRHLRHSPAGLKADPHPARRSTGQKRVLKLSATVGGPSAAGLGKSSSKPPAPSEALPIADKVIAVTSLPSLAATIAPEVKAAAPAPARSHPITSRCGSSAGGAGWAGLGGGAARRGGMENV